MISNASVMGSLKYVMLCARLNICFSIGIMSGYQSISLLEVWVNVKYILKYHWRTRDYMFVDLCNELVLLSYQELDFQSNKDFYRSTSRYVYTLSGFCCFYSNKGNLLAYRQFSWLYHLRSCYVIIIGWWHGLKI